MLESVAAIFCPTRPDFPTPVTTTLPGISRISSTVTPDPSDLEADFDEDVDVDGADFLTWQRGNGTTSGASLADGDANGDEAVNGIDLGIWQPEFGNAAGTDPGIQATIDDLVSRIEGADKIAFDVTIDDPFPATPSFLKFALHFTDASGVFYQKSSENISVPVADETTHTIVLDLNDFVDGNGSGKILGVDGFAEGTNFLRFGLASNTDNNNTAIVPEYTFQIDNIRLLTEIPPSLGDALAVVPEPSAALLAYWATILMFAVRRRDGPCR